MKGVQKVLFVVVLLAVSNLGIYVQSYNIKIGDIFEYDIVTAKEDLVFGDTIANFTGLQMGFRTLPEGSQFGFNVTSYFSTGFIIDIITDEVIEAASFGDNVFLPCIDVLANYPVYSAGSFAEIGQSLIHHFENGIPLQWHPLIPQDVEAWANVKLLINTLEFDIHSLLGENSSINNYEFQVKEKRDYNLMEIFLKVSVNDSATTIYTYSNSCRFAYSTKTGVLLGSRIKGYFRGQYENITIDLIHDIHIEMTSFDLGSFEIGDFATENSTGMTVICLVGSLFVTFFIQQKKKKKNGLKY